MKEMDIDILACPGPECAHSLKIKEIFSSFPSQKKEIKEGLLICDNCQNLFPIFMGIPIIVNNISEYLTSHFNIIEAITEEYGGMDKRLFADCMLLIRKNQFSKKSITTKMNPEQVSSKIAKARNSQNLIQHYHDLSDVLNPKHPFYDSVLKYKNQNPFLILEKFLQSHFKSKPELSLEIGCSYGGFLRKLLNFSNAVVGVDLAFLPLFYASCILKHLPIRMGDHKIQFERNSWRTLQINQPPAHNILLVVGNGESLPFNPNRFSVVSSLNVLDVTEHPRKLLSDKIRVLKQGGLFLSSAPFDFSEKNLENFGLKTGDNIWIHIKKYLRTRISIVEVQDNIPWLTYQYHRYLWVYNNLCFCGKKIR